MVVRDGLSKQLTSELKPDGQREQPCLSLRRNFQAEGTEALAGLSDREGSMAAV